MMWQLRKNEVSLSVWGCRLAPARLDLVHSVRVVWAMTAAGALAFLRLTKTLPSRPWHGCG